MPYYSIETKRTENNFKILVPNLPDCTAIGSTREDALDKIIEAIQNHLKQAKKKKPGQTKTTQR